ncbi:hypothetical protein ACV098_20065 (plasmid) [Bacillus velezensis]
MLNKIAELINGDGELKTAKIHHSLYAKLEAAATSENVDTDHYINHLLNETIIRSENEQMQEEKKIEIHKNAKPKYKKLDTYLDATLNRNVLIGITNELAGKETGQDIYTLTDYFIDYPSCSLWLNLTRHGEQRPIRFNNIKDIEFIELPENRLKVWIYMMDKTWRFEISYDPAIQKITNELTSKIRV